MSETKERYPRKRTKFLLGGKGVQAKDLIQSLKGQEQSVEGGWSVCSSLYNFGCPTPLHDRRSRNACFYRSTGTPPSRRCGLSKEGVFLLGGGVLPLGSGSGPKEGFHGTLSSCRVRRPHIVPVSGPAGSTFLRIEASVGEAVAHVFACF